MFEDDDLDDLDFGLDPPPDPQLLPHFPGSPIVARSLPLADSTSQVFNDGNRPIVTSTQKSHETMGRHSGLSNPQNLRPLGHQALRKSSGPQTSTQRERESGVSNSQTSLASFSSQALSIIPNAAAGEKQHHGCDLTSSQGFRFKALRKGGPPMSRLSANNVMEVNGLNDSITPSSPRQSLPTPDSPSYSPRSICDPKSPVDSQQLSADNSPNSSTSRIEPQQQLSPSYSPRSPFSAHDTIGAGTTTTEPDLAGNLERNTHTDQMPQIQDVSSVSKNCPSNLVNSAPSAHRPNPQPAKPSSLGDMSGSRSAEIQPKPTEIESSLRRCSVLSETRLSFPSSNSPPLDPSPPPRGTKRRFPGPAGKALVQTIKCIILLICISMFFVICS